LGLKRNIRSGIKKDYNIEYATGRI